MVLGLTPDGDRAAAVVRDAVARPRTEGGRATVGWIFSNAGRDVQTAERRVRHQTDYGVLQHVPWLKHKRAEPADRMDLRERDPISPTRCSLW